MDWPFFIRMKKKRHKVHSVESYGLRLDLYRVKQAKDTFVYEIDMLERKGKDFAKAKCLRQEDAAKLVKLLRDVDDYLNGRS